MASPFCLCLARLAVKGGPPVEVAEVRGEIAFGRIALSPDQRFLAYVSVEGSPGLTVAHVLRSDGGVTVKAFELPGSLRVRELSWFPTGKGLQYLNHARRSHEHLGTTA